MLYNNKKYLPVNHYIKKNNMDKYVHKPKKNK